MKQGLKDILAVIVLYKCKLEESETFKSLCVALEKSDLTLDLFVYDNSVEKQSESNFHLLNERVIVMYFHDASNPGISKAYNFAAKKASSLEKKWLLLLDQDTQLPYQFFNFAIKAIQKNQFLIIAPKLVSQEGNLISPCRLINGIGRSLENVNLGCMPLKNISLLNSGLIVKISLFNLAGGYNEKIPLDFSDHYFIEQLKKHIDSFYLLDVVLNQNLSIHSNAKNKVVDRFKFYCIGAKNFDSGIGMKIIILLRAIKYFIKYRSIEFLKIAFKNGF